MGIHHRVADLEDDLLKDDDLLQLLEDGFEIFGLQLVLGFGFGVGLRYGADVVLVRFR
jgi:hypothetical protein